MSFDSQAAVERERVAIGAGLFDQIDPDWWRGVNKATLDVSETRSCAITQAFPGRDFWSNLVAAYRSGLRYSADVALEARAANANYEYDAVYDFGPMIGVTGQREWKSEVQTQEGFARLTRFWIEEIEIREGEDGNSV